MRRCFSLLDLPSRKAGDTPLHLTKSDDDPGCVGEDCEVEDMAAELVAEGMTLGEIEDTKRLLREYYLP